MKTKWKKINKNTFVGNKKIIIVHQNGKYEGAKFEKTENINEISLRESASIIFLIGIAGIYFSTDLTIVNGQSMEPSLHHAQFILKSKAKSLVEKCNLKKNCIVKFKDPEGETSVKRILGMPGDIVKFEGANVFINGKFVGESENGRKNFQKSMLKKINPKPQEIKLKDGEYFVVGDNLIVSKDSREYGPIKYNCIISIVQD